MPAMNLPQKSLVPMAVLRNGSKCSHTTCMLRFFTISRPRFSGFRKAQLAITEP
jgi:hypothetical protein